jgi:hypothetical protein
MRHIILPYVACWALPNFSTSFHKRHDCRKKVIKQKSRFIFSKTFSATFIIQIRVQLYIIINVDFSKTWNLLNIRVHIIDDYEPLMSANKLLIYINLQVDKSDVYRTNSKKQNPSWEANRFAPSQEIPRILWNQKFITAFTRARQLSPSWARSIQSMPPLHPTSWRSILIWSSHLVWVFQVVSFSQVSPSKPCMHLSYPYVLHSSPISFLLIWWPEWYLVMSRENKAPRYLVFTPLSLVSS